MKYIWYDENRPDENVFLDTIPKPIGGDIEFYSTPEKRCFLGNRLGKGANTLKWLYGQFRFSKDELKEIYEEIDRAYGNKF